jgi:hypothetical protein
MTPLTLLPEPALNVRRATPTRARQPRRLPKEANAGGGAAADAAPSLRTGGRERPAGTMTRTPWGSTPASAGAR